MPNTLITGGCLCGSLRYQASEEPLRCMICHCETCRRHSGAPCLSFVHFAKNSFTWLGEARPKRYRSSSYAERGFCPACGSTVSMHEEVLDDRVQIAVGTLDAPDAVKPEDHVWVKSKITWLNIDDSLPRFESSSSAVPSKAE